MNRSMKTAVQVFGIIVIILLCTAIMNFGLAKVLGQGYIVGKNISIKQWLDGYHSILYAVTGAALLLPLLWYIMTRFIFKITGSKDVGKRTIWSVLWIIDIVAIILLTWGIGHIEKGISLYIVHVVLFSFIGYYLTTLLFTPAPYKYTPLGADKLRRKK